MHLDLMNFESNPFNHLYVSNLIHLNIFLNDFLNNAEKNNPNTIAIHNSNIEIMKYDIQKNPL